MAKQLNYTHPNGTDYPESYWRITVLYVNVPQKLAKFTFSGYKNQQARLDAKEPIYTRDLFLTGEKFDEYFIEVTNKTLNPQEVGYLYCMEFKDIPKTVILNKGTEDEIESIEHESFFKDSIDC